MATPTTAKEPGTQARPATDPAGPTGRLATWVARTTLDDVPASVRDRAKHLVLDGIACALVGAQLPVSRIGVEGVTALDQAGDRPLPAPKVTVTGESGAAGGLVRDPMQWAGLASLVHSPRHKPTTDDGTAVVRWN